MSTVPVKPPDPGAVEVLKLWDAIPKDLRDAMHEFPEVHSGMMLVDVLRAHLKGVPHHKIRALLAKRAGEKKAWVDGMRGMRAEAVDKTPYDTQDAGERQSISPRARTTDVKTKASRYIDEQRRRLGGAG